MPHFRDGGAVLKPRIKCRGYFTVIRGDGSGPLMPERYLVAEGTDFASPFLLYPLKILEDSNAESICQPQDCKPCLLTTRPQRDC